MTIDPQFLTIVFSAGAAFGAVKMGLNGTKDRVEKVERAVDLAAEARSEISERLVRVETKIDGITEALERL